MEEYEKDTDKTVRMETHYSMRKLLVFSPCRDNDIMGEILPLKLFKEMEIYSLWKYIWNINFNLRDAPSSINQKNVW